MKIFIFEFLVLIKYFLFFIFILGILVQAHQKNLVQAIVHCTQYTGCLKKTVLGTHSRNYGTIFNFFITFAMNVLET